MRSTINARVACLLRYAALLALGVALTAASARRPDGEKRSQSRLPALEENLLRA
jgi:hypothetical protein